MTLIESLKLTWITEFLKELICSCIGLLETSVFQMDVSAHVSPCTCNLEKILLSVCSCLILTTFKDNFLCTACSVHFIYDIYDIQKVLVSLALVQDLP